ncbi:MAG: hypothetical protein JXN64_09235 [Spirochaetes bacterium]|nr:hypothetical protein [Spirochaetota bacterium]
MQHDNSLSRLSSKVFLCLPAISFIMILCNNLSAIEIKRVDIIGSSIELETREYVKSIKGDLSNKDIEAIGVRVTNEYHEMGYTTSYVKTLRVRNDGVLEIHVNESRIAAINITGITGKEKNEIELSFSILTGYIYNRSEVERKAEAIKRLHNLSSVKIYPINYENTGDVFLSIKASKKSAGDFYGGIGLEPIYGISPSIGYYHPFTDTALDIYAKAGYREGRFRRAEGDLKFFLFPDSNPRGIYLGTNIAMFVERWETLESDYKRLSLSPILGYRAIYQYFIIDLYANEIISDISDYKAEEEKFRDYDTRLTLEVEVSNKANLLSKKDATGLQLTASSGKSDLSKKIYAILSGEFRSTLSPFSKLRIIPQMYSYYTTMDERYFWQYVYDKRLMGFFDDYTASKWKNTAGLDIELEIVPQFIYAGPFVNTGYFLDEELEWKSRTGGGLMGLIEFKNSHIGIYFAWDLSKDPSKGGFSIIAGGNF